MYTNYENISHLMRRIKSGSLLSQNINKVFIDLNKCKNILNNNFINIYQKSSSSDSSNNMIENILNINKFCKIIDENVLKCNDFCSEDNKYFKCFWPKCEFKSMFNSMLESHHKTHINNNIYKCDYNN